MTYALAPRVAHTEAAKRSRQSLKPPSKKAIESGSFGRDDAPRGVAPSTARSLAHLVTVLMSKQMRWDPKDPWKPGGDRLVLSRATSGPSIYAALADLGAPIVPLGKGREPPGP